MNRFLVLLAAAFFALSTFLASAEPEPQPDVLLAMISYSEVGRAEWRLERTRLTAQAVWDPKAAPVPLPPAEAVRIAIRDLQKTSFGTQNWTVLNIALRNVGVADETLNRWYYLVEVRAAGLMTAEQLASEEYLLTKVVLLDGSIVTPTFKKSSLDKVPAASQRARGKK